MSHVSGSREGINHSFSFFQVPDPTSCRLARKTNRLTLD